MNLFKPITQHRNAEPKQIQRHQYLGHPSEKQCTFFSNCFNLQTNEIQVTLKKVPQSQREGQGYPHLSEPGEECFKAVSCRNRILFDLQRGTLTNCRSSSKYWPKEGWYNISHKLYLSAFYFTCDALSVCVLRPAYRKVLYLPAVS